MKSREPLKSFPQQSNPSPATSPAADVAAIYVVDDEKSLTDLYAVFLESAGYRVRTFNDRVAALAALKSDRPKPDLLITDFLGRSMPVDGFMRDCRIAHPALRVLMASGFGQTDLDLSHTRPDRFIQKPFSPEQLRREVRATLAGEGSSGVLTQHSF